MKMERKYYVGAVGVEESRAVCTLDEAIAKARDKVAMDGQPRVVVQVVRVVAYLPPPVQVTVIE